MDILFGNRVCLCLNSNSMKNKTITREHLVMGSQHNSSDPWILSSHYYIITTGDSLAMCTFPCESVIIAKCAPDDTHHKRLQMLWQVFVCPFVDTFCQRNIIASVNEWQWDEYKVTRWIWSEQWVLSKLLKWGFRKHCPVSVYPTVILTYSVFVTSHIASYTLYFWRLIWSESHWW